MAVFRCPAEATGFGTAANKLFPYTHYGHNNVGLGYQSNSKGADDRHSPFSPRNEAALLAADQTVTYMDSSRKSGPDIDQITSGFVAWRHGGDTSYTTSGTYDIPFYNGDRANASFYDGHASTVQRKGVEALGRFNWFQNGILYLDGKEP